MTKIPSDKEFERASRLMEQDSRNLDEIRLEVKKKFKEQCPLFEFYILPQRDVDFRAYIFFENISDIDTHVKKGTVQEIKNFVYMELERVGRGKRGEVEVDFELDSDENVVANYEGDYYLRLH